MSVNVYRELQKPIVANRFVEEQLLDQLEGLIWQRCRHCNELFVTGSWWRGRFRIGRGFLYGAPARGFARRIPMCFTTRLHQIYLNIEKQHEANERRVALDVASQIVKKTQRS